MEQVLTGLAALGVEGSALRDKVILETIHQDNVCLLVEQLLALGIGNLAHGSEAIHIVCRLLLDGVLRLHVELAGHLVAVVSEEIIIERFVVASDGATNRRGMRSENGGNLRYTLLQIEGSHASHPFVCLKDHIVIFSQVKAVKALHHLSGSVCKHRSFIIITIGMK